LKEDIKHETILVKLSCDQHIYSNRSNLNFNSTCETNEIDKDIKKGKQTY